MTTYIYQCTQCGHRFGRKFPFTQHPSVLECPECRGEAARFMGQGGITDQVHFKGWDWGRKNLLDPASDDPRLDPLYFDDLLEREDGPKSFFTSSAGK